MKQETKGSDEEMSNDIKPDMLKEEPDVKKKIANFKIY